MATILVRRLSEEAKEKMRQRANANGRSLEAEVRAVIEETALDRSPEPASSLPGRSALDFIQTHLTPVDASGLTESIDEHRKNDRSFDRVSDLFA